MKARDAGRNLRGAALKWERAAIFTFDDTAAMEQFRVADGEWEIHDGVLRATGGDGNRAILLYRGCFDPVRIEFDAVNRSSRGLIGDITVLLNSLPDKSYFSAGYALTTGSYWNTCTTFYRGGIPLVNTALSPVVSGRKNRVAVTFDHGHIRYEMNGELLLETWDEHPFDMLENRWIGVRTWATFMSIDNMVILRGKRAGSR